MTGIVEENQRLVALLMVRTNLVSHRGDKIRKSLKVNIPKLHDVSLFRAQPHNSFLHIFTISLDLRKINEALEAFVLSALAIVGVSDDDPDVLCRPEFRY